MKDYYRILGVSRSAGMNDIKRSYRMLVQKYHPDVNPSPVAAELIKEINEAYDVLGDVNKKREYDNRLLSPYTHPSAPQPSRHRDPGYKRTHRPAPKINPQLELMKRYMPYAVGIAWAGCAMCFFLLLDFTIPHRVMHETVERFSTEGSRRSPTSVIVTSSGRRLGISSYDVNFFNTGQDIEVIVSAISATEITIYIPENGYRVTSLATIYRNFLFVPVLLLIASSWCVTLTLKNRVEHRFNLAIVSFFLLIITLFLVG